MKHLKRLLFAIMVGAFTISCNDDTKGVVIEVVKENLLDAINGQDIFKTVYFFEGSIMELLPSIDTEYSNKIFESLGQVEFAEFASYKDEILNTISNSNPEFFDYFDGL